MSNLRSDYRDRDGKPISGERHSELFFDYAYKTVGSTYSDDGSVHVSTVWIGMLSTMFETMVFLNGDYGNEATCERYNTDEEALLGHEKLVNEYITRPALKLAMVADGSAPALLDGAL